MKTKVKVEKEINPSGECFYMVSSEGKHIKALSYIPDAKEDSSVSEKNIFAKAMKLAKQIEENGMEVSKVIIYETPEN